MDSIKFKMCGQLYSGLNSELCRQFYRQLNYNRYDQLDKQFYNKIVGEFYNPIYRQLCDEYIRTKSTYSKS